MERLNWHMAEELAKFAEVHIVGPEGSAALAPVGIVVREAPLKPLWKFLWRARSLARREARHWKPNLVLAGSGFAAPIARAAARVCGARTAVYVHGLDVAVRHLVYRAIWLLAIRRADRVIANSNATASLCRDIGIDVSRLGIVHPGVDMPPKDIPFQESSRLAATRFDASRGIAIDVPLKRKEADAQHQRNAAFRRLHHLEGRRVLLSVGRLSARKGLREFVTHCLPRIVAAQPDVMLLVVGDVPNQALHAEAQTPESIQAAADSTGVGGHLKFLGTITDYGELGLIYRAADVHIFPVRAISGDPEGFGMVTVEAAAHGLPTVAFATGGVSDAVAEGQSGYLVAPNDYMAFAQTIMKTLAQRDALRESCINFARQFAWSEFGARMAGQLSMVHMVRLDQIAI